MPLTCCLVISSNCQLKQVTSNPSLPSNSHTRMHTHTHTHTHAHTHAHAHARTHTHTHTHAHTTHTHTTHTCTDFAWLQEWGWGPELEGVCWSVSASTQGKAGHLIPSVKHVLGKIPFTPPSHYRDSYQEVGGLMLSCGGVAWGCA